MEAFFKQFRRNMARRPEPAFEEADWLDLEKRLDQQSKKRPAAFAWWWLALPIGLLSVLANAYLFLGIKESQARLATLEMRSDTVYRTHVEYRTDTIYSTRVIREKVMQYFPIASLFQPHHVDTDQNEQQTATLGFPLAASEAMPAENQDAEKNTSETQSTAREASIEELPPLKIQALRSPPSEVTLRRYEQAAAVRKQHKSFQFYLHAASPKSVEVGATASLLHPFAKNLDYRWGNSMGLQSIVVFSPHLQLWVDAAQANTYFVTDRMGDDIGVPLIAPPSDDYKFISANVPQPYFQFSLGAQYVFRPERRLRPSLGLGYGAVSLQPYEIVYEFQNEAISADWSLDLPINRRTWLTDLLMLRAGLDYHFSKKWSIGFRADYRSQHRSDALHLPSALGLGSALRYKF